MDSAVCGDEWYVLNEALCNQQPVKRFSVVMGHPLYGGYVRQCNRKDVKAVAPRLVEDERFNWLREAEFAEATFDAHFPRADEADIHLIFRLLNSGQCCRA